MTVRRVSFRAFGVPQPKGSARGFVAMKAGGKPRAIVTSDNARVKSWERTIRDAAQAVAGEVFFREAVTLRIQFFFSRPKTAKRPFMTTRPDLSKCLRSTEDALIGVLFQDDSQIIEAHVTKAYVDGPSGAYVTVEEVMTAPSTTNYYRDLFATEKDVTHV